MSLTQLSDFIFVKRGALTSEFCRHVIAKFESDTRTYPGRFGAKIFNPEVKRSLDLNVSQLSDWKEEDGVFFSSLTEALEDLRLKFPNTMFAGSDEGYNIQKSVPGDFYVYHEDWGQSVARRNLAVLWYLNDVVEGGETEFEYQALKVKPEEGKLLLFPPYWMYRHRGCTPTQENKYVCVTWLNLPEKKAGSTRLPAAF